MKCRAKMIDGSPVTFDWGPELCEDREGHPYIRRECIGEGFFVVTESYAYGEGENGRIKNMRLALERAGVDTATVEYWSDQARGALGFAPPGAWIRMFAPDTWYLEAMSEPLKPGINWMRSDLEVENARLAKMLAEERGKVAELQERLKEPPRVEWLGDGISLAMIEAGYEEARICDIEFTRNVMMGAKLRHSIARIFRAMEKAR